MAKIKKHSLEILTNKEIREYLNTGNSDILPQKVRNILTTNETTDERLLVRIRTLLSEIIVTRFLTGVDYDKILE